MLFQRIIDHNIKIFIVTIRHDASPYGEKLQVNKMECVLHVKKKSVAQEDEVKREYDDADEYKKKLLVAKLKVEEFLAVNSSESSGSTPSRSITSVVQVENKKTYEFPKFEVIKYSGEVKD